jgi:phage tail-like protein
VPRPHVASGGGHTFGLELDGVQVPGITQVTGLKMEQDVVELKESAPDGTMVVRRLPGRWKSPEITLRRGLSTDTSFEAWVKQAQAGSQGIRRDGSVSVFDPAGALVKRYVFSKAWPKSLGVSSLDSGATSVLVEELVLVCEHLEPE